MSERWFTSAFAAFIWRWRLPMSIFIVLGALALAPRANVTRIDNDITAWFSKEDPVYQDYERFRQEFGGTRTLIIALQAATPDRLFSPDTLQFIEQVTGDIERVDTVHRVDSLATATIVEAIRAADDSEGGLDVRPLIEDAASQPPGDVRRRALGDDLLRGDLVSDSGTVTAIVVSFDEDRIDAVRGGVIQAIHDLVDPRLPAGIRAYYNGSLEISETYNRITLENQIKFTPPILLFTILAIYVAFRSWRKTMLAMFAILMSIFWTLGLYSLMGFSYNVLTSMLVPLVVVLAIADDVHIMQRWDEARRHESDELAFKETVSHLVTPLFGASATTALGMLSLATSNVVAVRSFGIGSAVGIMVDFVISIVLVPTLLAYVKTATAVVPPHERYLVPPLRRVARFTCAHPGRVLSIALVIGSIAAVGISRLRVDTNHINFFAATHPLGQSARVIDQELSGVYSFQLMLEGPPDSLNTPDALQRIDRLQNELRQFEHVRKVTSIADYVKRINKELNDGREEANVIPGDQATVSQELFVFALGGEGRHELERIVASDYSRAQINVKLQSMSSDVVLQHVEQADRMAREALAGTGISVMTTGSGRLFSTLDHYLVQSQVSSFGTAFLTVFGVIFIVFRSWRFGALTIVPNVLPVIAVLGVMGYLDISMNIATIMVASIALGVVDDDTIHFINRYRREVSDGASTDEAIERATVHEGRASLTTAVINCCGYAVLFLSEYKPTAWFGGLLALTMAVAFLAEIFILPPIIKLLPRVFGATSLRRGAAAAAATTVLFLGLGVDADAQSLSTPTGHVSVLADVVPNRDSTELRARVFAEEKIEPSDRSRLTLSGFVEGLVAQRPQQSGTTSVAIARIHEASGEVRLGRVDLYAGYGRVVWGRLDELQPTDVINPLDVSRFFFEGRSEARLPVVVARGRVYFRDDVTLEAVYVPVFRRGRFDQLDEMTSPFNVTPDPDAVVCLAIGCPPLPLAVEEREPSARWGDAQAGVRFGATAGRLDWSVSAYRGFEAFPFASLSPDGRTIVSSHPRFTMIGADFETVAGQWGMRGELAAFVRDSFQGADLSTVEGRSFDAGAGVDRRIRGYQLSATVLLHREEPDVRRPGGLEVRQDVSLIASADRSFSRERHTLRAFSVYNPSEGSAFLRAIGTTKVHDDAALEVSAGWFPGDGRDTIGRFSDSDFVYARLKYFW